MSVTAVICTIRQPSAPLAGETVSSSSYPKLLSESVDPMPHSWRILSALCLLHPRAIPLPVESLYRDRRQLHLTVSLPSATSETKVRKMFGTANLEEDKRTRLVHPRI